MFKFMSVRAVVLIAVGTLLILKSTGLLPSFTPIFHALHIVGPIALIALGVKLLYKNRQTTLKS